MTDQNSSGINKLYFVSATVLGFILPAICGIAEMLIKKDGQLSFALIGKWFIFSAVGLRLFIAGIKQTTNPAFTAKEIFHINNSDSLPIIRELGFANICFGLIGIISLFVPQWRIVSAFGSGIYYAFAAIQHLIKKPAGANEKFALVTDFLIFICLLIYFAKMM